MMVNPLNGRRSRGSRLFAIALLVVAAVVLSTATVLGLHWASSPSSPKLRSASNGQGTGFVQLHRPAPAVRLPNLDGQGTVSLASMAGKPIVLNFWSSTCTVCKKETPTLAQAARAMRGKVTFVGVDSADIRGPATSFVARYDVPYANAFDPQATAAAAYRIYVLPVTFFLSPSGRTILGENTGALTPAQLRTILHRLYGVT
jgi:cytochrome c biogenesis protein CcmG, thiol:disulfide interchange protein DsbE